MCALMFETTLWAGISSGMLFEYEDSAHWGQVVNGNSSGNRLSNSNALTVKGKHHDPAKRAEALTTCLRRCTERHEQVLLIQTMWSDANKENQGDAP